MLENFCIEARCKLERPLGRKLFFKATPKDLLLFKRINCPAERNFHRWTYKSILVIDSPGGKRNRKIKINAQLRIFKCKPMIKDNLRTLSKYVLKCSQVVLNHGFAFKNPQLSINLYFMYKSIYYVFVAEEHNLAPSNLQGLTNVFFPLKESFATTHQFSFPILFKYP